MKAPELPWRFSAKLMAAGCALPHQSASVRGLANLASRLNGDRGGGLLLTSAPPVRPSTSHTARGGLPKPPFQRHVGLYWPLLAEMSLRRVAARP